jgi:amino acid transporter
VLIFAAVAIAYIAMPESFDLWLAGNPIYVAVVVLAVFWGVTLYTFRGIASSAKLSTFGGLFGTIVPGAILIVAAIVYIALGHPVHMSFVGGIVPKFTGLRPFISPSSRTRREISPEPFGFRQRSSSCCPYSAPSRSASPFRRVR